MNKNKITNENPHCNDYDDEGRCGVCGQFDCYECDWGYPFDGCDCTMCETYREAAAEEAKPKKQKKEKAKAKPSTDEDLKSMSKSELIAEVKRLRAGINSIIG